MEAVAPSKEAIDMVKEAGGEAFKMCFQCGLCTVSCPWNYVRTFMPHQIITQTKFGLVEMGEEKWWLCSTCNMCVSRCPREVAITDILLSVRKIVVEFGYRAVPNSLRIVMGNLTSVGNPWGESRESRTHWSDGLDIPLFNKETEVLYFSCCVPAYDQKVMGVAVATSRILKKMGVNFGILGTKEGCCGESIQKVGSDQLFENLTRNNIEVFNQAGVKDVIVSSPHCYVTFNNKYPKKGGRFKVTHFTRYLAEQLDKGKLQFSKELCKKVVYHDPCYLGRHSGIYEEPRKVLSSIPGVTLMDEVNSRENSLCCGGGGGRIWMETKRGERFSEMLVKQAVELGAEVLVTACPYCIVNFKDSVLAIGGEDILEIRDISEIVQEAI